MSTSTTAGEKRERAARGAAASGAAPDADRAVDLAADLPALASPRSYGARGREVPPEVAKFVEDAHEAWKRNPAAWQVVTLSSGAAVGEVFQLARHYAAHRATPLTFQRKKTGDPCELVYRVRDKITQRPKDAPSA